MKGYQLSHFGLRSDGGPPVLLPQPHRHNDIELNFVEAGMIIYDFSGRMAQFDAGMWILFWGALPHRVVAMEDDTQLHWVTMPVMWLMRWSLTPRLVQRVLHGDLIIHHSHEVPVFGAGLFQRWHRDLQMTEPKRHRLAMLEIEAQISRIDLAVSEAPTINVDRAYGHNARIMASFIADNYARKISVEDVAAAANISPNYAMTSFREHFSLSIVDFITQYRVMHAQRLLLTTDMPIADIGFESGFGSISRFYEAFKLVCGMPPRQYRLRLRANRPTVVDKLTNITIELGDT